jgi:hypothetical protein
MKILSHDSTLWIPNLMTVCCPITVAWNHISRCANAALMPAHLPSMTYLFILAFVILRFFHQLVYTLMNSLWNSSLFVFAHRNSVVWCFRRNQKLRKHNWRPSSYTWNFSIKSAASRAAYKLPIRVCIILSRLAFLLLLEWRVSNLLVANTPRTWYSN